MGQLGNTAWRHHGPFLPPFLSAPGGVPTPGEPLSALGATQARLEPAGLEGVPATDLWTATKGVPLSQNLA